VSDAVLRQDIGGASDVGFAWLLLTDYELTQLAQGTVEETVQRLAERTAEDLAVKLRDNAARAITVDKRGTRKPKSSGVASREKSSSSLSREDRGGLPLEEA
jgi:hypothetical protein